MTEIINHAITIGDVLMFFGCLALLGIAFVAYAIVAVNMGWRQ